jgi:hypothetical protein
MVASSLRRLFQIQNFCAAIKDCGLERSLRCGIKPHLHDCPIVESEQCRPARGSELFAGSRSRWGQLFRTLSGGLTGDDVRPSHARTSPRKTRSSKTRREFGARLAIPSALRPPNSIPRHRPVGGTVLGPDGWTNQAGNLALSHRHGPGRTAGRVHRLHDPQPLKRVRLPARLFICAGCI